MGRPIRNRTQTWVRAEPGPEHANAWNSFGPPATFAHKNAIFDRWCDEVGRDRSEIERAVLISVEDVAIADRCLETGATHLIVMTDHPFDLAPVEALVARRDT